MDVAAENNSNAAMQRVSSQAPPVPLQRHHRHEAGRPNADFYSANVMHCLPHCSNAPLVEGVLDTADIASLLVLVVASVVIEVVLSVQPLVFLRDASQPEVVVRSVGDLHVLL